MFEPLTHSTEKEQGKLLTIVGGPEVEEPFMFGKYVYLFVFYCLCYVKDISTYMSQDQVLEDRDPYLNKEENIRMDVIREEHQRDVAEEGYDKNKMYVLRWDIYVKEKDELIKRFFWCLFHILKGRTLFGLV